MKNNCASFGYSLTAQFRHFLTKLPTSLFWGIIFGLMAIPKVSGQCSSCPCLEASPAQYSLCGGGNVTLRGKITFTAQGIGYIAEYTWFGAQGDTLEKKVLNRDVTKTEQFIEYATNKIGNYTLKVKFIGSKCDSLTVLLNVSSASNLSPTIKTTPSANLTCKNPSTVLTVNETYPMGTTIEWTGSGITVTSSNLTVSAPGSFSVKVTTTSGCSGTSTVNINDQRSKPAYSVVDTHFIVNNLQTITIPFGTSAVWRLKSAANLTPLSIQPSGTGNLPKTYQLVSDRATGLVKYRSAIKNATTECISDSLTFTIVVNPGGVFIPEIITPNGDGANDTWTVVFPTEASYEQHEVHVFNRLGIEVYTQDNMLTPWNANGCPNGVYFYKIINKRDQKQVYKGALTILGRQD